MNNFKYEIVSKLKDLAEIGQAEDGGMTRFSFTEEDKIARDLVKRWMIDLDMHIKEDAAGNIIARLGSFDEPAIAMGSHIDSVPNGGIYDGPLGVTTALEVIRRLKEEKVELESPLEIIVFSDEEGARFGGGLFGSKVMTGILEEDALDREDKNGIKAYDAMKDFGYDPDNLDSALRSPGELKAYFEVHIEQAKVLEDLDHAVGIVSGIAGPVHFYAEFFGRADHAGATPMNLRQDALLGAAKAIIAAEDIANRAGESTVATVGSIKIKPDATNVIPGYAKFTFDVRDINVTDREWAVMEIKQELETIAEEHNLDLKITELSSVPPVMLDEELLNVAEEVAKTEDVDAHTMVSGAAHDAMNMTMLTKVLMFFVRSKDGVSHCPEEFSSEKDINEAADLLYHTVKKIATENLA
jgi:allantoate deiminase